MGPVSDSRRVAFNMPFATSWEVPSGATSERLATKATTVADEDTERLTWGHPRTGSASAKRADVYTSE